MTFGKYVDIYMSLSEKTEYPQTQKFQKRFDWIKNSTYLCETNVPQVFYREIYKLVGLIF
jgi:hypothetical protein